jgi:hypothetical protein
MDIRIDAWMPACTAGLSFMTCEQLADGVRGYLDSPPQRCRVHRRVPETRELIIQDACRD